MLSENNVNTWQEGYKIINQSAPHFITFATTAWVDVFTRKLYRDIFLESIKYCQDEKGMRLNAWCTMSNHIHMILSSLLNDPSGLLRDFKKFTAKEIIKEIKMNPKESRKEWMLDIFAKASENNCRNKEYQFWSRIIALRNYMARHSRNKK